MNVPLSGFTIIAPHFRARTGDQDSNHRGLGVRSTFNESHVQAQVVTEGLTWWERSGWHIRKGRSWSFLTASASEAEQEHAEGFHATQVLS